MAYKKLFQEAVKLPFKLRKKTLKGLVKKFINDTYENRYTTLTPSFISGGGVYILSNKYIPKGTKQYIRKNQNQLDEDFEEKLDNELIPKIIQGAKSNANINAVLYSAVNTHYHKLFRYVTYDSDGEIENDYFFDATVIVESLAWKYGKFNFSDLPSLIKVGSIITTPAIFDKDIFIAAVRAKKIDEGDDEVLLNV